jgi:hypothetical protein
MDYPYGRPSPSELIGQGREHNDRNLAEKGWDWAFGEGERPNMDPGAAPSFPQVAVFTGPRETQGPAAGTGWDLMTGAQAVSGKGVPGEGVDYPCGLPLCDQLGR